MHKVRKEGLIDPAAAAAQAAQMDPILDKVCGMDGCFVLSRGDTKSLMWCALACSLEIGPMPPNSALSLSPSRA